MRKGSNSKKCRAVGREPVARRRTRRERKQRKCSNQQREEPKADTQAQSTAKQASATVVQQQMARRLKEKGEREEKRTMMKVSQGKKRQRRMVGRGLVGQSAVVWARNAAISRSGQGEGAENVRKKICGGATSGERCATHSPDTCLRSPNNLREK